MANEEVNASGRVSSSALGISRRKIIRTSTSIWVRLARSFARIARRYSVSIRVWVHMKLLRRIVLTVTWRTAELPATKLLLRPSSWSPDEVIE
jgi:hypothetical protein